MTDKKGYLSDFDVYHSKGNLERAKEDLKKWGLFFKEECNWSDEDQYKIWVLLRNTIQSKLKGNFKEFDVEDFVPKIIKIYNNLPGNCKNWVMSLPAGLVFADRTTGKPIFEKIDIENLETPSIISYAVICQDFRLAPIKKLKKPVDLNVCSFHEENFKWWDEVSDMAISKFEELSKKHQYVFPYKLLENSEMEIDSDNEYITFSIRAGVLS